MKPSLRVIISAVFLLGVAGIARGQAAFAHPGILHTRGDLDWIKQKVAAGEEPWKSGFAIFKASRYSQADYTMRGPFAAAARAPKMHDAEMTGDCLAAYQNALMWAITGNEAHAKKSLQILDAWASTLKEIPGADPQLSAGFWGFDLANAAEILRYTYPGWRPEDTERVGAMLRTVFYPILKDFATFANGNWDATCIATSMAIGVFSDDRAIFDRAVDYFRNGSGNGRLTNYVFNEAGQCQESGRDQAHTQLGLGLLCEACEIAWNQGIDLYATADNRLLKGFEFTARYNLGEDVPFTPHTDTTGKYVHKRMSPLTRGKLRAIWEMAWNHYHTRRGLPMPYTERVLAKLRPEGAPFGTDNPGFGTLLFTLPAPSATH